MTDHQVRVAAFAFLNEQTTLHDDIVPDGLLHYRSRGTDPSHRDNVGMKRAMEQVIPR